MTSVLLWVDEVHRNGYSVNDLKNGNVMVNRRGQVKGIDMDSYAPFRTTMDKIPDFYFLGVSLLLTLLNVTAPEGDPSLFDDAFIKDEEAVKLALSGTWSPWDVESLSDGRVETDDLTGLVTRILTRCRRAEYARSPELFSDDIDRLIRTKRRIFLRELVLD
jgi:hypothetical protein